MDICPNRITLEAGDTFADLFKKVRKENVEVRPHRRHTVSAAQAGYEVIFNFLPDVPSFFAGLQAHYVHTSPLVLANTIAEPTTHLLAREKLAVTVQRGRGSPCYEFISTSTEASCRKECRTPVWRSIS